MSSHSHLNFRHLIPKKSLTNHCIILDLDETLVHTEEDMTVLENLGFISDPKYKHLKDETYVLQLDDDGENVIELWGTQRPNLILFLLFCFTYFKVVAVWSAGQSDYVKDLVKKLFSPLKPPDVVFTFDDCVENSAGDCIKPLTKMINSFKNGKHMSLKNTFILDDRLYTFEKNPKNGVLIPAYSPSSVKEIESEDTRLEQLKYWFLRPEVRFSKDVRTIPKEDVFFKPLDSYARENYVHYDLES